MNNQAPQGQQQHQPTPAHLNNIAVRPDRAATTVEVVDGVMTTTYKEPVKSVPVPDNFSPTAFEELNRKTIPPHLNPNTMVKVDGMESTLQCFINTGVLEVRNGEIVRPEQVGPSSSPADQANDPNQIVNSQMDQLLTDLSTKVQPTDVYGIMNDLTRTGEISENYINNVAASMGVEPSEAAEIVDDIIDRLEGEVAAAMPQAFDVEHFFDWAREHKTDELGNAMLEHYTARNMSQYRNLALEYVAQMDNIDPERILASELGNGLGVYRSDNGAILVRTPHGEMPWSVAVRQGLIQFT